MQSETPMEPNEHEQNLISNKMWSTFHFYRLYIYSVRNRNVHFASMFSLFGWSVDTIPTVDSRHSDILCDFSILILFNRMLVKLNPL